MLICNHFPSMQALYCLLWLCICFLPAMGYTQVPGVTAEPPRVLVTVPAYRYFVQRIAGATVQVELMVPVGASAHTYEPTPKQVLHAARADLWFITGEPFEAQAWRALQGVQRSLKQVDLRQGVVMIAGEGEETHCACHPEGMDLHMWLSPKVAMQQVDTIVQTLKVRYPAHAADFMTRGEVLKGELSALDREIRQQLPSTQPGRRLIVVSHPAFAYFGRDYGIKQLSVEVEGKDPTPRQLTQLIVAARQAGIKAIYVQPQYSNKGALLIARQLGARLVEVDPYAEDYFTMMRSLAHHFAEAPLVP
jgi:zinc transport system substrate-binding protein